MKVPIDISEDVEVHEGEKISESSKSDVVCEVVVVVSIECLFHELRPVLE